jgi:hypothetical protein
MSKLVFRVVLLAGGGAGYLCSADIGVWELKGSAIGVMGLEVGGREPRGTMLKLKLLTRGSLITDSRVTQAFRKEKIRSNNSNDGNYLLLSGFSQS